MAYAESLTSMLVYLLRAGEGEPPNLVTRGCDWCVPLGPGIRLEDADNSILGAIRDIAREGGLGRGSDRRR